MTGLLKVRGPHRSSVRNRGRRTEPFTDADIFSRLHSTNPLEQLNREVKQPADAVGIFPNEPSIVRLSGTVSLKQNDEWQPQHRQMQAEAMAENAEPTKQTDTR